jgi:hypothetical protein
MQQRTTLNETSQSIHATSNGARWNISTHFMQHGKTQTQDPATSTTAEDDVASAAGGTAARTTADGGCSPPPSGSGGARAQPWGVAHAVGLPSSRVELVAFLCGARSSLPSCAGHGAPPLQPHGAASHGHRSELLQQPARVATATRAEEVVSVLDRQTYQGGTRGSRLCGEDRD